MKKYKPNYLGKVLPEDDKELNTFMHTKYDKFSTVYNACKEQSENISDISPVTGNDESFAVNVIADDSVKQEISKDENVIVSGDQVKAK